MVVAEDALGVLFRVLNIVGKDPAWPPFWMIFGNTDNSKKWIWDNLKKQLVWDG